MAATEHAELVRQLRAIPAAAPDSVRERVRALGEPPARRAIPWRKSFFVLAPACALALLAAAAVHGVLESGEQPQAQRGVTGQSGEALQRVPGAALDSGVGVAPPSTTRRQDYQAWLRVRVKDLDSLTDRTNEAMQVARSLGGYVASVQQSTAAGRPGQADLVLRIPVARVEDALVQLAGLGTVLDRHLSIRDLEQLLRAQQERIVRLKLFIARAIETLKQELPADVRLRLQLRLAEAKASLERATGARKSTLREAALSRISLSLTTQRAVEPTKGGAGRFERAVRDAGSFLAGAGAIALFVLIVLSPLLVLGIAALWGARAYRRREERRLLAST